MQNTYTTDAKYKTETDFIVKLHHRHSTRVVLAYFFINLNVDFHAKKKWENFDVEYFE